MKLKHLFTASVTALLVIPQILYASDWAAKINNETISTEEFSRFYYFQCKMMADVETDEEVDKLAENPAYANHPMFSKTGYLDHLITQKLLYKKAMEDKTIDPKELETLKEMIRIQAVAQYYLGKKLKDKITVTDDEVNKYYEENKAELQDKPEDSVKAYIKKLIYNQKSREETNKYIMNLLSESKVDKSGFANSQDKKDGKTSTEVKQEGKK